MSFLVLLLAYLLVIISSTLFSSVAKEMLPLSARNQFLVYQDMPKESVVSATESEALSVYKWLSDKQANPEISDFTTFVGDGGPRFYLAICPTDPNPASAIFIVNTDTFEGALAAPERAERYFLENHPAVRLKVKSLVIGGSESGIVEVKLTGPDGDRLLALAEDIEASSA